MLTLSWLPIVLLLGAASQVTQHAPPHRASPWRDTPPINQDGTINAYMEIAKGDRRNCYLTRFWISCELWTETDQGRR